MTKLTTLAAAAAIALPGVSMAGGLDPVVIETVPVEPVVVDGPTGSMAGATPWIIAGLAVGLIALAASDGSDDDDDDGGTEMVLE